MSWSKITFFNYVDPPRPPSPRTSFWTPLGPSSPPRKLGPHETCTTSSWQTSALLTMLIRCAAAAISPICGCKGFHGESYKACEEATFTPTFRREAEGNCTSKVPCQVHRLAVHANRCKHLATCLHVQAKGKGSPSSRILLDADIAKHTELV